MSTILNLAVERDHIDSLTRANGLTALSELIWNSLDADASEIYVTSSSNRLRGLEKITVRDNGHGLPFDKANDIFAKLGGSEKKLKTKSPKGRILHGKEGKGRYRSLALGDLVTFKSIYKENQKYKEFTVTLDKGNLTQSTISEPIIGKKNAEAGFEVVIQNINERNAGQALSSESIIDIEERFASYWTSHPTFTININGRALDFTTLIKNTVEKQFVCNTAEGVINYTIKVIEWNFDNKRKTYLCNENGIPLSEISIGLRTSLPISIFIQSSYIERLDKDGILDIGNLDETLESLYKESKNFGREYVRNRLHEHSKDLIEDLKDRGIYPYVEPADSIIEESKRKVFDIVALEVYEHLPAFDEQNDKNQKFTLNLIKESLERDSGALSKILSEVLELPNKKKEELVDLLENTSLSSIIDAMTEISNRLKFLNALEQIIYDTTLNRHFKERRHLHKIITKETWIFGDEYTLGADDLSLKNVLKAYLKESLGRDDFEEIIESADNSDLNIIPDVCLWSQYSMGSAGEKNLVIELKKPNLDAGLDEKLQIEKYASRVAQDPRFPKTNTKWVFMLITKDVKPDLTPHLSQKNRKYGHVSEGDNFDVYVFKWGDLIREAKIRHEFLKEKLNLNLIDNEQGLEYLKSKYNDYIPSEVSDL